jgi:cellulose synthase/poly-beta-1,6-N-acetylglucosamine synthase-like glycosyltransferase
VALVVIVAVDLWALLLFVRAGRLLRSSTETGANADDFTWVFLVPALNEEVTIRDSVERLLSIPVSQRHVVVVDDGSDDRTAKILAELEHDDLHVVTRALPIARQGKAAALNHAYRQLRSLLGDVNPTEVIVVIVDADGRLDGAAPAHVAALFADAEVGGVQALVRIYNRRRPLTWCQDVEFSVYGFLYQAGRNAWGTAGMGGNGQFNRLSALDEVADEVGPWRDRLTEDQDLGLRLVVNGWKGRQALRATVDQQGLPSARALFRQRTRWSQGNLQAMTLMRSLRRAPFPLVARIELGAYLLMPVWQGIIGLSFVAAVTLAILGVAPFWADGPSWLLLLFYLLAFGGSILGCIAARRSQGARGWLTGFLIGNVYALYTWTLWPVLFRSIARQLVRRHDWTKTEREPIETSTAPAARASLDATASR